MKRIQTENRASLCAEVPLHTPYCVFVDPCSRCNFRCRFCMNSRLDDAAVMEWGLFKKIVDDLREFRSSLKTLRLYGLGEPLLNARFADMVRYAKDSGTVLSVDTTTNASMIDERMAAALVNSGLDRINISIEAMTTERYQEFTQNNSVTFEGIVKNVERLFGQRGRMVVFAKINGDFLTAEEREMFRRTFTPITDGCDVEHTMSCWRDFDVPDANRSVGVYGQPLREVLVCPYVFYSMFVHADGQVSACFLDWNRKLLVGDAGVESVKEIWQKKNFLNLREGMLRKERKSFPPCAGCQQLVAGMPVDLDDSVNEILERIRRELPGL